MHERQLIPMDVAGTAVLVAARMLLEEPDVEEFFGWWRPEAGGRPPGRWSAAEGTRLYAVAERGNGVIGLAALTHIRREEHYARVCCSIVAQHRQNGAEHWTLSELIRQGVRLDGLRHLETSVRAGHSTSLSTLESLGFRRLDVSGQLSDDMSPSGYVYLRLDLPSGSVGYFPRVTARNLCA
ncbi:MULTISPECIES: GNAT family N-acetyltransferase [Myxococcus]|uniref:GNAT family N-acetyltransferase n=1 Tax=Myxococcus TaxID=32 RepID=UPI001144D1F8|nr:MULTISPECIES: GNAT family N-acetyltransferase [Myxococcus]MCK8498987.1 hypothetical protein [Myxococcus fulvus]